MRFIAAICLFGFALMAQTQQPSGTLRPRNDTRQIGDRERFIGTWELVSSEDRLTDGSTRPYPTLGPHGKGYLIYTADRHMCAVLMNPDRPMWKDPNQPTDREKLEAFAGFGAYCGRYELDEAAHIMYHFPEISPSPNYIGTKQKRPYIFKGDVLQFADKATDEPGVASWTITWRKPADIAHESENRMGTDETVQQVLAVDEARRVAMLHADVAALDQLLSDDVSIFWGDGTADNKDSALELFRSGRLRYSQFDYKDTRVRLYGDTAIVTGNAHVQYQSDGQIRSSSARVSRVYVRQDGKWRMVASQTTRMVSQ